MAKYFYSKIYNEKALVKAVQFTELLNLEKEKLEILIK